MTLSRREFLKVSAAGSASAAVGAGIAKSFFETEPQPGAPPYTQDWVPTICLMCPGGCGVLVRTVNGRAVKIEGNPLHPVNTGKVCPKANAALQVLYDPDRIKNPLRQVGERGSGNWQPISWDEAIGIIAQRLSEIRANPGPHTVAFMTGRVRGQMGGLIDRFLAAYGSPNHIRHDSLSVDGERIGNELMYGHREQLGYDWDNCNYVLSFGRAFLEASRPTVRQIRAFSSMRRDRPNRRGKFVQVDTRFSITAAKADEWIPIRPGSDGALALGIANVIVAEGLYDFAFVQEHTFGFEDWKDEDGIIHQGFRSFVLNNYHPVQVEALTGVNADTIVRLAREFATTQPAIATGGRGTSMQTNGVYNWMAVQALNALVGSIEVPGGVMIQNHPPYAPWPDLPPDPVAEQGRNMPRLDAAGTRNHPLATSVYQSLPEHVLASNPYPLSALFLYYTNPLFSAPDVRRFYDAFEQIPFIVSFSPFLDDSSAYADLILPDHTFLERLQDDEIEPSLGYSVVGLRQPAVEPLLDTRDSGDVLIQIARAMGGYIATAFPWDDFTHVVQYRLSGLWASERGNIRATSFSHFWDELVAQSVWYDAPYAFGQWGRVFNTPSGKFEFFSQILRNRLESLHGEFDWDDWLDELEIRGRGDMIYLPHYEPPRFVGDDEYPFYLNTYKLMAHAEGRGANAPWLQEKLGLHVRRSWDAWVEINPETAASLGIGEDEWVWVESTLGEKIKLKAVLYPGARPDTVNIPFGQGHRSYGRWAKDRGENPNRIIADEYDRVAGTAGWYATRVKITKA
ncbi:MAG TPA: molybdopterin-dependent oxidoreductase [Anaerolineales bacterium]|nr:molybdopterin-dependent oxidoreductase [Anaerolineales bacterium]